jgi:hypothetical protein
MNTVYLGKKNGVVVHHMDKDAMLDLDGIVPDKEVTLAEFEAAGGIARIIGNKIILGKTDAERTADAALKRIAEIDRELASIDSRAGTGRAPRALLLEYAGQAGINGVDVDRLEEAESEAQVLRNERAEKQAILNGI